MQVHKCVMSSSPDNGCDKGIRELWKPLFDQYQVDLVVNGHDHDYERSLPVRGCPVAGNHDPGPEGHRRDPATPSCALGDNSSDPIPLIDTTQGTVYLVLGGGGTNAQDNVYATATDGAPTNVATAGVHTVTIRKTPSVTKPVADAWESPVWSAKTDPGVGGANSPIASRCSSVDPGGVPGGTTTMTVTYYHAVAVTASAADAAPTTAAPVHPVRRGGPVPSPQRPARQRP